MKKYVKKIYMTYKKVILKRNILNTNHSILKIGDKKQKIYDYRKKGFSIQESILYDLKNNDYKDFINTWEAYQPRLGDNKYFSISDDKYLFSIVFGKFVETPKTYGVINNGVIVGIEIEHLNDENLYNILVENEGGVIKDRCGSDGFEVYVFDVVSNKLQYKGNDVKKEDLRKIVSKFKYGIIQNKIKQGDFENSIFNKSINTVRIISMRKKDYIEHEIIAACQRIGTEKSAPVDNFNQGGGTALIDIETGKLGKMITIFDIKNGEKIFYSKHPSTNSDIEGKVIPNWNEIKQNIVELTKKLPFFDYIAWDIVIQNNGFAVIEINMKSSLNVFQIHKGMRNEILGQKYRDFGYLEEKI